MKRKLFKLNGILLVVITVLVFCLPGCIKIQMASTPTPTTLPASPAPTTIPPVISQPPQTPQPQEPQWTQLPPSINSFTASSSSIKQGEQVTLSWNVSGATQTTIAPDVGSVNATAGTAIVKPASTTAYQLTAQNQAGKADKSLTINVTPVVAMPDLVVTSVYMQMNLIFFKVKNNGNAASVATRAKLYVNDAPQNYGDTYVDPLAAGEEKTLNFGLYVWNLPVTTGFVYTNSAGLSQYEVKVVVDESNVVAESNEKNNSSYTLLGQLYMYKFVDNALQADWMTNPGLLTLPVMPNNAAGAVFVSGNTLSTYPAAVSGGFITGHFADKYMNIGYSVQSAQILTREVTLPKHCVFTSKVSFDQSAPATAKARFYITVLDRGLAPVISYYVDLTGPTAEYNFKIDLSSVAGQAVTFILRLESKGTPGGDLGVWTDPQISQVTSGTL